MVIPVYNQDPTYLKLSLNSVLNQTYNNFHLVIVIDGADEQTRNIVFQYEQDNRVKIIDKEVNEGISVALNTGFNYLFEIGEVQYLTWGSSDNVVYPNFIEKLRNRIKNAAPEVGVVYSCFHHIGVKGEKIHNEIQQNTLAKWQQNKTVRDLLDYSFIGTSFMYKKVYAKQIGGYYLDPVQTYDFWLRLTELCDIEFIPEALMAYRFESPLSLSRKIQTDIKKHRWWRDQYNLARHMARLRRGIPYETTILFPIRSISEGTIKEIESILEQQYHNYYLILIDKTRQIRSKLKILGIQDPRIRIIDKPMDQHEKLKNIKTPHTQYKLIYNKQLNFFNVHSLSNIIKKMKMRSSG